MCASQVLCQWLLAARSLLRRAQEAKSRMVSKLHEVLKPFLLRRVKEDVEKAIPAKQEITLYAPLTETQRKLQDSIMQRTIVKDMDELAQSNGVKRAHRRLHSNLVYPRPCRAALLDDSSAHHATQAPCLHHAITPCARPVLRAAYRNAHRSARALLRVHIHCTRMPNNDAQLSAAPCTFTAIRAMQARRSRASTTCSCSCARTATTQTSSPRAPIRARCSRPPTRSSSRRASSSCLSGYWCA